MHNAAFKEKIPTIMKKMLSTKKSDPDGYKYYKEVDGVDYYAACLGMSAAIMLINKYDARKGTVKFIKPLTKGNLETIDKLESFPDVEGLFTKELDGYKGAMVTDIDKWIAVHESFGKLKNTNGNYPASKMVISEGKVKISLYDNEVESSWEYDIDTDVSLDEYFYDPELMLTIFKMIKDFKLEKVELMVKDNKSPLFFKGSDSEYIYNFALNRKLVK